MIVLARGPWSPAAVEVVWRGDTYDPDPAHAAAADSALARLAARGSPGHDSMAARLVHAQASAEGLALELQPVRWALRLVDGAAARSLYVHCLVRDYDGRWLAGRRAPWVAVLPGTWHLGAAGSVAAHDDPISTARRELQEEWDLAAGSLWAVAVVAESSGQVALVLVTEVDGRAPVRPNDEHDKWAWWPRDAAQWPTEAPSAVRRVARLADALTRSAAPAQPARR